MFKYFNLPTALVTLIAGFFITNGSGVVFAGTPAGNLGQRLFSSTESRNNVLFFGGASQGFCDPTTLSGIIYDPNGRPLRNAQIQMVSGKDTVLATSSSFGYYELSNEVNCAIFWTVSVNVRLYSYTPFNVSLTRETVIDIYPDS